MGTSSRKSFQGILKKTESLLHKERNAGEPPMTCMFPSILTENSGHISDTLEYREIWSILPPHTGWGCFTPWVMQE